jgi:glucose-6-phosphate isomerase
MSRTPDSHVPLPGSNSVFRVERLRQSLQISAGPLGGAIRAHADAARQSAEGLWRRDPSVWTSDPAVHRTIARRLGWLDSPALMAAHVARIHEFAAAVRHDRFTDVVLLGMGGSSLAPEVIHRVMGVAAGWPRFHMLDSTDPAAVIEASTPPQSTLYVLASKSGTTIEPNSLAAYFRGRLETARVPEWADHFVAITDEGTSLAERARMDQFRDVFLNPSDIGGRYSAISFFGLVPAALMGHDVEAIVEWAAAMLEASTPNSAGADLNPAVDLGLFAGAAAREGRDKLTLAIPPRLEAFGLWIEQLIAESTGKTGRGIAPIVGERLVGPSGYAADRVFVGIRGTAWIGTQEERVLDDVRGTFPVGTIELDEPAALGAEFLRWEIATAIAGALLSVNPFDEPNVQQAKTATRVLLDRYASEGRLPIRAADGTLNSTTLTLSTAARRQLEARPPEDFLALLKERDYLALLAFVGPDPELFDVMRAFRFSARDRARTATMFGYGPRYLHSTGQLHKGGPDTGVFLLVTAVPTVDLPIPGEPFSFATLELAQALGDFASLDDAGRRALHLHLPTPSAPLLRSVLDQLLHACAALRPD